MDLFRLFSVPFKVYKDHMLFVRVCADLNPNTSVSLFFFFCHQNFCALLPLCPLNVMICMYSVVTRAGWSAHWLICVTVFA